MNHDQYSKHQPFAGIKHASMKRRCIDHDYTDRQMYLITIATEGRKPLFGNVVGDPQALPGSPQAPHIELTPLGAAVADCWNTIPHFHHEVSIIALQMMPDHIHGIIFITRNTATHLGTIISGFKAGCNNIYKEICPNLYESALEHRRNIIANSKQQAAAERSVGLLFETGYNDKILLQEGELDNWRRYLADNPRRLLLKRQNPDLFRVQRNITYDNDTFSALGNIFLLDHPDKIQVRCSRSLTAEQIEEIKQKAIEAGRRGYILVSPSISPGEKACTHAAFENNLPLIIIRENGFTDLEKPKGRAFDACAQGRLLFIAPWEQHNDRRTITRHQCQDLNALAFRLCQGRQL